MRDQPGPTAPHKSRERTSRGAECHRAARAMEEDAAWLPGAGNKDPRENVPRQPHPPDSRWSQLPRERRSPPDYAIPAEPLAVPAVLGATLPAWQMANLRFRPKITYRREPLQTIPHGLRSRR